jgi:hypothetical protein
MIEMEKKYKTSEGQPVRILCVDGPDCVYPVVGYIEGSASEQIICWMADGQYNVNNHSGMDLVETSPWDDFQRDEPVMVKDQGAAWVRRYFSHIDDKNRPCTFIDGTTSWSTYLKHNTNSWDCCRRPTPDEM